MNRAGSACVLRAVKGRVGGMPRKSPKLGPVEEDEHAPIPTKENPDVDADARHREPLGDVHARLR